MYETFDHTADLGLRIRSGDLNTLFNEAGQALFSVLVEDLNTIELRQTWTVHLTGDNLEFLLFDWLRELLYLFEAEQLALGRFDAQVQGNTLEATAWGEPLDPSRHLLLHEVKAITYHHLQVQQTPDGWLAEVIVDI